MKRELESIWKNEEFGQLRTFIDLDGRPWMAGVDVARALGYKNPTNAVKTHCKANKVVKHRMNNKLSNGNYEITFIEESNFYRLVIKSTFPSAEKFQDWVVEEILPSLRQTGKYEMKERGTEEDEAYRIEVIKEAAKGDSHVNYLLKVLEEKEQELIKAKQSASVNNSGLIGFNMLSTFMSLRPTTLRALLEDIDFGLDNYVYRRNDLGDVFLDKYIIQDILKSIKNIVDNFIRNHPEYKTEDSDKAFIDLVSDNLDNLPF